MKSPTDRDVEMRKVKALERIADELQILNERGKPMAVERPQMITTIADKPEMIQDDAPKPDAPVVQEDTDEVEPLNDND